MTDLDDREQRSITPRPTGAGRFSILVIGDTQYLFDGDRTNAALLTATFEGVAELQRTGAVAPVRHVIHVGDVTEHGWEAECAAADAALTAGVRLLGRPAMTIATGNHDVEQDSGDDRGPTPFLSTFGPRSALVTGTYLDPRTVEHGPGGYSSWRPMIMPGTGRIGVLALDWRPSRNGLAWAADVLSQNAATPTILVCHDVAAHGTLTANGQLLHEWLRPHRQVFLVIGGHHWPSTRVRSAEREYHVVNYQQLPFGGAGAARVYDLDHGRGRCQVISLCPALRRPDLLSGPSARRTLALAGPDDQFSFDLPAALGGGGESPWQAAGLRLIADITPEGQTEFEARLPGRYVIEVEAQLPAAPSDEWQVLLARLGQAPDGSPEPLAQVSLSTENFLGWQGFLDAGQTWATSHEYPPGEPITLVISNGANPGMWVNDDPVGRVDSGLVRPLADGPWRWRVGAGQHTDRSGNSEPFQGNVSRVRIWSSDA